jgi:Spy/CpxP family protein refolding chaperone
MNSPATVLPDRSNRLLWGIIGVLLVLNFALVGWLLCAPSLAHSRTPAPLPARSGTGATFLVDTLQLSASQRQHYDTLRARYLQQVQPLAQTCRRSCQQYFAQLDPNLTDAQLAERSRAALANKVAVDVATMRHLQQLAALCTPTQRQLLQRLLTQTPSDGCAAPGGVEGECFLPLK